MNNFNGASLVAMDAYNNANKSSKNEDALEELQLDINTCLKGLNKNFYLYLKRQLDLSQLFVQMKHIELT